MLILSLARVLARCGTTRLSGAAHSLRITLALPRENPRLTPNGGDRTRRDQNISFEAPENRIPPIGQRTPARGVERRSREAQGACANSFQRYTRANVKCLAGLPPRAGILCQHSHRSHVTEGAYVAPPPPSRVEHRASSMTAYTSQRPQHAPALVASGAWTLSPSPRRMRNCMTTAVLSHHQRHWSGRRPQEPSSARAV